MHDVASKVFQNRVLRSDEVTGGRRELRNEELRKFSSPSMIRVMKSRRMRWAGNVAWGKE
jgi:hypothetical protein